MSKIKVIPGEILTQFKPTLSNAIMRVQVLNIDTGEQIDTFEFLSIWTSYKADKNLPKEKRKVKIKNKLQMKNAKGNIVRITIGKGEKTEIALRRLLAKDRRYELASMIEAAAAQQEYNEETEVANGQA